MSLPSLDFVHLMVSEIWPGQDFIGQGHYGNVKGHIKVSPTKYQLPKPCGFRDTGQINFFLAPAHLDTMGENNTLTALTGKNTTGI